MTIVAHADDDLLFMNPDIAHGIASGEGATTVYVTAGDAGYEDWYWQGREMGAKAAYALMAGESDWVDETIEVTQGDTTFSLASSYLASAPEVRLYFLRMPDGGGVIENPDDTQLLAKLEDGTRSEVSTIDGVSTYMRADLVGVLAEVMALHSPDEMRLQVAEGSFATGEHTDHTHATEFALEALAEYGMAGVQVTHYVNYQSDGLEPNLSAEDAQLALSVMQAYAAFDQNTTDVSGALLPVYSDWIGRQYVAETYTTDGADAPAPSDPITPPAPDGSFVYALGGGQDDFLFNIDPSTGEITAKDWFTPSLDDAWDANDDYVYEVTRVATPVDGGAPVTEMILLETVAEGVLAPVAGDGGPDTPTDPEEPLPGEPLPEDPAPEDPPPEEPAPEEPTPEVGTVTYSLGDGQDDFLFDIDPSTGAITAKDWFTPSLDDAWDANDDYVYEVTRIATPVDGGAASSEVILLDTVAEGVLSPISGTDAPEDPVDPVSDPEPEAPADPVDTPTDPGPVSGVSYALDGPDAYLFVVDAETGDVATQDWFTPSLGDAWDQNEDYVYELTRTGTLDDGTVVSRDFLSYQTVAEGSLSLVSATEDLMLALAPSTDGGPDAEAESAMAVIEELASLDDLTA